MSVPFSKFYALLTLCIQKPLNGYFTNSEDPDEVPHDAAFHQGLHCLLRLKKIFRPKNTFLENYNLTPQDMYNGLAQLYRIKPEGRIH